MSGLGYMGIGDGAFGWGGVCGGVVYVGLWGVELVSGGGWCVGMGIGGFERGLIKNTQLSRIK